MAKVFDLSTCRLLSALAGATLPGGLLFPFKHAQFLKVFKIACTACGFPGCFNGAAAAWDIFAPADQTESFKELLSDTKIPNGRARPGSAREWSEADGSFGVNRTCARQFGGVPV